MDLRRPALNQMLFYPERDSGVTPRIAGLEYRELEVETEDGERLHAWWIPASGERIACALFAHGNGGNIAGRIPHAAALGAAGIDVLLFDYRGYGASSGSPSEEGTYLDARAALAALREQPEAAASPTLYIGESLGGAIALWLAIEEPPDGLVLQSTFTSVRDAAKKHFPFVPAQLMPDAYPSLSRIRRLRAPLLVMHGTRDEIVPFSHGEELFAAAPEPKRMHVFDGLGHNDLLLFAETEYAQAIAEWTAEHVVSVGTRAPTSADTPRPS
jgi:fermentation-respiration switch protein FrsA (DUF1100 family)